MGVMREVLGCRAGALLFGSLLEGKCCCVSSCLCSEGAAVVSSSPQPPHPSVQVLRRTE